MRQKRGGEGTRSCAVVRETDAYAVRVDDKIWFSGKDFNELCRRCVNSSKGRDRVWRTDGPHSSSNGAATHTVDARSRNGASQDTKGKENKMEEEAVTANGVFQKRDV